MKMASTMRATFSMIKQMEKDNILTEMDLYIKVILKTTDLVDGELKYIPMEVNLRVNFQKDKS